MGGVLGAGEPGFNQGKTGLHEHDQEARDQRPHEVDGYAVLSGHVGQLRCQRLFGAKRRDLSDRITVFVFGGLSNVTGRLAILVNPSRTACHLTGNVGRHAGVDSSGVARGASRD